METLSRHSGKGVALIVEGVCLEETCDCDKQPLPFRFSYFFRKDPCEKCLVRAACQVKCEPKHAYWDQCHSVIEWKKKFRRSFESPFGISMTCFVISVTLLLIIILGANGCKRVNQERAVQYYDQNVKNFPEENP